MKEKSTKVILRNTWLYLVSAITLTSCTVNLQQISTKGVASDLVDDTTTTTPTTDLEATIPVK